MEEGTFLQTASAEEFCERIERQIVREPLGKNFLGAKAWESQGIEVRDVPPIPKLIHTGEKIKNTHLLVLVPKTVDGESFSALKLDELCATRKGSADSLLDTEWSFWKSEPWASTPQSQSEWALIAKSDPDPEKVSAKKHFRMKNTAAQQKVHEDYYPEYREVKTVQLMTAVLLYDLVNKKRLLSDYLRCEDPNAFSARVWVGSFLPEGLDVDSRGDDIATSHTGRALARKLL